MPARSSIPRSLSLSLSSVFSFVLFRENLGCSDLNSTPFADETVAQSHLVAVPPGTVLSHSPVIRQTLHSQWNYAKNGLAFGKRTSGNMKLNNDRFSPGNEAS